MPLTDPTGSREGPAGLRQTPQPRSGLNHELPIVRAGRWLTRRRSVLFAPLFTVVLLTARLSRSSQAEWIQDLSGLLCIVAGVWLRIVAASYHESREENHPITAGPYAWVRHPLYLANFLLGLGVVLISGWQPMFLIYPLVFIPVYWAIIRSEEAHMSLQHPEDYLRYLRSVPAMIPRGPYRGTRYGLRNDYKMKRGSEWLKVVGYGVAAAALILFKEVRRFIRVPAGLSLPFIPVWFLAAVILLAVIFRPRTRSSLLRTLQTALVILCAILIALRVPGAVPKPITGGIR